MEARVLTLLATTLFVSMTFAATADVAHARRGVAVINTGEDMFPAGPLPEPYDQAAELQGFQAGYRCSIFGVFWMYATWWDCKPVAVNMEAESYIDDAELVTAIAAKYTEADIQAGFWKGTMRWLLLGILLLIGGFFAWAAFSSAGESEAKNTSKPEDDKPQPDIGGA